MLIGRIEEADIGVEGTVDSTVDEEGGGGGVTARSSLTVVLMIVSPAACSVDVVDSATKVTFTSSSSSFDFDSTVSAASNLARFLAGDVTNTSSEDIELSFSSSFVVSKSAALSSASSNAIDDSVDIGVSFTGEISGLIANLCLFGGGFFFPLAFIIVVVVVDGLLLVDAFMEDVLDVADACFLGERRGEEAE